MSSRPRRGPARPRGPRLAFLLNTCGAEGRSGWCSPAAQASSRSPTRVTVSVGTERLLGDRPGSPPATSVRMTGPTYGRRNAGQAADHRPATPGPAPSEMCRSMISICPGMVIGPVVSLPVLAGPDRGPPRSATFSRNVVV